MSMDEQIQQMRCRSLRFLGNPLEKHIKLRPGIEPSDLIKGDFIGVNDRREVVPLTENSPFGGCLKTVYYSGNRLNAVVAIAGTLYGMCDAIGGVGEPVYLTSASSRTLTMNPLNMESAIRVGALLATQPDNPKIAHIDLIVSGARD